MKKAKDNFLNFCEDIAFDFGLTINKESDLFTCDASEEEVSYVFAKKSKND